MPRGAPTIRLQIPPYGMPHLTAWGRAPDGWWALVEWLDVVTRPDGPGLGPVRCSGWAPASAVAPMIGERYRAVPRLQLDADPRQWPEPPAEWGGGSWTLRTWHYGRLGDALSPPAGGWRPGDPPPVTGSAATTAPGLDHPTDPEPDRAGPSDPADDNVEAATDHQSG